MVIWIIVFSKRHNGGDFPQDKPQTQELITKNSDNAYFSAKNVEKSELSIGACAQFSPRKFLKRGKVML